MQLNQKHHVLEARAQLYESFQNIKVNPMDFNLLMVHMAKLTEVVDAILENMDMDTADEV